MNGQPLDEQHKNEQRKNDQSKNGQSGERMLREWFRKSADVIIRSHILGDRQVVQSVLMLYCEGMADQSQINSTILPQLNAASERIERPDQIKGALQSRLEMTELPVVDKARIEMAVYSGSLLLYFTELNLLYSVDISNAPQRKPEESSTEVSIKGPRDAFTEDITTNIALVRKRLKNGALQCEKFTLGRRSFTTVALLYIRDIANAEIVDEVRNRLRGLDTDGVLTSSQLEERLGGSPYSLFPLLDYIGRPDFVAESLLKGRFALLVDGAPMSVYGPANLLLLIKSPEDPHLPFYFVALERTLRVVGLLLALFLPGFWVAVSTFNIDQIPFPLVATLTSARVGLPLSGSLDFFLMQILFELFREAGVRLPKAVGQTVAVVGGLIIGDAAIRAGFTSPTTLVVVAVSSVSTFTLINQTLVGSISVIRFAVLILSTTFGMFGLVAASLGLLLYLASLDSFGISYLSPMAPLQKKDLIGALFAKPWAKRVYRPLNAAPEDDTRLPEEEGNV